MVDSTEYKNKECKVHGNAKFIHENSGRWRCTKCRSAAVQKRRDKVKLLAVEYKGGKCISCGYDKCVDAIDFHHRDSSKKDFGIASKGYTRSWGKIKLELDKCDILCANCHREKHAELKTKKIIP